uniref:Syntaxin 5 n=1 Tax=Tetraselmis sp. GSL018 TaxID=582737 RepID=A0A061QP88_9CHLO
MPPFGTNSARDRTQEFHSLVERLQKQPGVTTSEGAPPNGPIQNRTDGGASSSQSEFAKKASVIGRSIHETSTKLQKLAQLAKRTSMFDDPAEEIDRLTTVIKRDIQGLNTAIAELQRIAAANREGSKQSTYHSTTVVDSLRSRLKDTTKEFKDVLTTRTESLKVHQSRRQMYSASPHGSSASNLRAQTGAPDPGNGPLLAPRSVHSSKSAHELFGGAAKGSLQGAGGEKVPLLSNGYEQQQQQQQLAAHGYEQQQQQLAAPQDTYMSTRAEALRNVESTILELGGIFQQLAHMVQEQGEMAVRIDENVEESLQNVEGAQAQLLKYLNTISSNRWLIMKIFAVLVVFLVFFVVFIV